MQVFLRRFGSFVTGVLNGFDRLVFRGTLRSIVHGPRMMAYLSRVGVLMKDFGTWSKQRSDQIKEAAHRTAQAEERPEVYLNSSETSKEDLARSIAQRDHLSAGLVTVLRAVEPCMSFEVRRDREAKRIELQSRQRRCTHLYHYWMHPQFGFLHVRLQTWAPYDIRVCLNGREWLARQLDAAGIGYRRHDNCFLSIDDVPAAQALMDEQLTVDWPKALDELAHRVNPIYAPDFEALGLRYYWSTYQSEWASDFMFAGRKALAPLYPRLIHHGMTTFASGDVLRFLGRRVCADGRPHPNFRDELTSDLKVRPEGVRLKHRVGLNSVKMYDKAGSVLRIETTINNPRDFQVYRTKTGAADGTAAWQAMRKTVADLPRRAEVSQKSNERYANALATIADSRPLRELTDPLCRPTRWHGQRVRALNPLAPEDLALLKAVMHGDFLLNGLRNRDLCQLLYPHATDNPAEQRRRSAAVTRKLRMLRAHSVLHKVPHTHRYVVSTQGQHAITALLVAREADIQALTKGAA